WLTITRHLAVVNRALPSLIMGIVCVLAPTAFAGTVLPSVPPHLFGDIPALFSRYDVVLRPDKDEADWWAGAPSVTRGEDGEFWLAARMRTAESPRGLRGYEIRILRSKDGVRFKEVHRIRREEVP